MILGLGAPNPDDTPPVLDPQRATLAAAARNATVEQIRQLSQSCPRRQRTAQPSR